MNSWAATLICAATVIAFVLFLIPPLHSVAWIIGLVLVVVVGVGIVGIASKWASTQDRIDRLGQKLTRAYEQSSPVQLSPIADDTPNPDSEFVATIRTMFPQDTGLVQELRIAQVGSISRDSLATLEKFLTESEHASLLNRDAHYAFMELFRTGSKLHAWVEAEMVPSDDDDQHLVVKPGDTREGGWHEFGHAQSAGEKAASNFVKARSTFERVVFENSLAE